MRSLIKIITIFLIFSITSCSFLNKPYVEVTVDSDPSGAKIYVDDVYYGNTARVIKVVPDKTHNLRLEMDGYEIINIEMKTRFSMRKGREGSSKCMLDFLGSFLILPIMGLKSVHCRSFTEELYDVELPKITTPQQSHNFPAAQMGYPPPNYNPFSSRNYYLPLQAEQSKAPTPNNIQDNQNINYSSRPIFNNQSEFANNGNGYGSNRNFNRKSKVGYY